MIHSAAIVRGGLRRGAQSKVQGVTPAPLSQLGLQSLGGLSVNGVIAGHNNWSYYSSINTIVSKYHGTRIHKLTLL